MPLWLKTLSKIRRSCTVVGMLLWLLLVLLMLLRLLLLLLLLLRLLLLLCSVM